MLILSKWRSGHFLGLFDLEPGPQPDLNLHAGTDRPFQEKQEPEEKAWDHTRDAFGEGDERISESA
jgi:hypothetical protein